MSTAQLSDAESRVRDKVSSLDELGYIENERLTSVSVYLSDLAAIVTLLDDARAMEASK